MKCNVGKKDKTIRLILGIIVIGLGIYFKSWWGAIGIVLILTSVLSWCPCYLLFGIRTCEKKS